MIDVPPLESSSGPPIRNMNTSTLVLQSMPEKSSLDDFDLMKQKNDVDLERACSKLSNSSPFGDNAISVTKTLSGFTCMDKLLSPTSFSLVSALECCSAAIDLTRTSKQLKPALRGCGNKDHPYKSVRFATDIKTGRLLVEKQESEEPLTEPEIEALWYTPKDFRTFRRSRRKEGTSARQSLQFCTKMQALYTACLSRNLFPRSGMLLQQSEHGTMSSPTTRSSSIVPSSSESAKSDYYDTSILAKCVSRIVSMEAQRGIETVAFPALAKDRRRVIQIILNAQTRFSPDMPVSEREVVLASKSRILSRQFQQLARLFGRGDEIMAQQCWSGKLGSQREELPHYVVRLDL